jgi:hypothetical protein
MHIHSAIRTLCGLLPGMLLALQLQAADPPGSSTAQPAPPAKPIKAAAVYKPPMRGSPSVRVGGAKRGGDVPLPELHVLAPDHIALTVQAQPVFQWYLSEPATVRFEFALVRDDTVEPVLETDFGTAHSSGIQQYALTDTDISLEPGVVYQWSVALIPDEQARSGDVFASGMVERIEMPQELAERLSGESEYAQAIDYAGDGIWYDALALMTKLIAENPADTSIRLQRAALLEQVGLPPLGLPDERPAGM